MNSDEVNLFNQRVFRLLKPVFEKDNFPTVKTAISKASSACFKKESELNELFHGIDQGKNQQKIKSFFKSVEYNLKESETCSLGKISFTFKLLAEKIKSSDCLDSIFYQ